MGSDFHNIENYDVVKRLNENDYNDDVFSLKYLSENNKKQLLWY